MRSTVRASSAALLCALVAALAWAPAAGAQTVQPDPQGPLTGCTAALADLNTPAGRRCARSLRRDCANGKAPSDAPFWCNRPGNRESEEPKREDQESAGPEVCPVEDLDNCEMLGEPPKGDDTPGQDNGLNGNVDGVEPGGANANADEPAPKSGSSGGSDIASQLGMVSPFCRVKDLSPEAKRACRSSGSIQHEFPLSHYGLDTQVDTGLDKPENNIPAILHAVVALIWTGLLWLLKGSFLLLEWSYSLDPLGESLEEARTSMVHVHEKVLGKPWTLAAIAIAGAWGIWNGLARLRISQTLAGLGLTVVLMVVALVIIHDPVSTVGKVGKLSNDASLGVLSAASTGTVDKPAESFADSQRQLFHTLVSQPWCALQFGDVGYCTRDKNQDGLTNQDLWLLFPAEAAPRRALWQVMKGEEPDELESPLAKAPVDDPRFWERLEIVFFEDIQDVPGKLWDTFQEETDEREAAKKMEELGDKAPARAELQGADGATSRFALLILVVIGMLGAILVLLWIGIKLMFAAVSALFYLLLAPVMLLAPAFGDAGRHGFGLWLKRLAGALLAKLIYSFVLAVILQVAGIITKVGGTPYG